MHKTALSKTGTRKMHFEDGACERMSSRSSRTEMHIFCWPIGSTPRVKQVTTPPRNRSKCAGIPVHGRASHFRGHVARLAVLTCSKTLQASKNCAFDHILGVPDGMVLFFFSSFFLSFVSLSSSLLHRLPLLACLIFSSSPMLPLWFLFCPSVNLYGGATTPFYPDGHEWPGCTPAVARTN